MKRKNNLYENIYVIKHIEEAFNEVCRNTKNKILCEISRWFLAISWIKEIFTRMFDKLTRFFKKRKIKTK